MEIRLAIADDSKSYLDALSKALALFPDIKLVFKASNGQELLDKLKHQKVDVILLDLRMPVLSGLETLSAIRLYDTETKIIILSFFDVTNEIIRCWQLKANGYILKGVGQDEIYKAIKICLESGYYLNELTINIMLKVFNLLKLGETLPDGMVILDDNELKVLKLHCAGKASKEIAMQLYMGKDNVEKIKSKIRKKTNTHNAVEMVLYAVKHHLIDI